MSQYAITFARSARKELEALSRPIVARVLSRIEALERDPRPSGCRKLVGQGNLWRIRVGDTGWSTRSMTASRRSTSQPSVTEAMPTD